MLREILGITRYDHIRKEDCRGRKVVLIVEDCERGAFNGVIKSVTVIKRLLAKIDLSVEVNRKRSNDSLIRPKSSSKY